MQRFFCFALILRRHFAKEGERHVVVFGEGLAAGNMERAVLRDVRGVICGVLAEGKADKQAHGVLLSLMHGLSDIVA